MRESVLPNESCVVTAGKQSLRLIAAVIPEFATFRTEPEVISPGSEADVVITIDASLIPCGKRSFIYFSYYYRGSGRATVRPNIEYKSKLY